MSQDEIDKLLKVLKNKTDKKVKYQDDILNFIEFYNIKSGRQPVRLRVLYDLYHNWSKNPVSDQQLSTRLQDYFTIKNYHHNKVFMINQSSINVSKEYYETLAQEKKQIKVIQHKNILEFLDYFNIKKGQYYVSDALLLKLFRLWGKNTHKKIHSQITSDLKKFHTILLLYFPMKKTQYSQTMFGINQSLKKELAKFEKDKSTGTNKISES